MKKTVTNKMNLYFQKLHNNGYLLPYQISGLTQPVALRNVLFVHQLLIAKLL